MSDEEIGGAGQRVTALPPLDWCFSHARALVHFSFKTINSNMPSGGIRLASSDRIELPYLSLRTIGYDEDALDFASGGAAVLNVTEQVRRLLKGEVELPIVQGDHESMTGDGQGASTPSRRFADCRQDVASSRFEIGTDAVSRYARQLLIKKDGRYVALTPMTAGGFCAAVSRHASEINEHAAGASDRRHLRRARYPIGGKYARNIGCLAGGMQEPLFFDGPRRDRSMNALLSTFYKGISFYLCPRMMRALKEWWNTEKALSGRSPNTMKSRQVLRSHILSIVNAHLENAHSARSALLQNRDFLPLSIVSGVPSIVSEDLDPDEAGLLDPGRRTQGWAARKARAMTQRIAQFRLREKGELVGLSLDADDLRRIEKIILGALR